ncbi:MAG TPA: TIM barrel protein [Rectinemataceae bacterium]
MNGKSREPIMSLVVMNSKAEVAAYLEGLEAHGLRDAARFELSYTMSPEFLNELEPLIESRVASLHACCPATRNFPNFASADPEVIAQSFSDMEATLATARRFGAAIVVLHAGYLTDSPMPASYEERKVLLAQPEFANDVRHADGAICGPDYNKSPKYRRYATRTMENLVELAERYALQNVKVAAENLNPRVGYLFHTPDEMIQIASLHPNLGICLDVGHLYISSFAYGFDYIEGIRSIIATGKVLTCHLHSNSSSPSRFRDDHHSIDRNGFPIARVLEEVAPSGANLVLELLEEPVRNHLVLRGMLAETWP